MGEVFINDINLRDINEHSLRNKLNYIMQDNFLFSLSIKDNISLYREIEFNDIVNACKKLKIHEIIMTLPNKYDTILIKNGTVHKPFQLAENVFAIRAADIGRKVGLDSHGFQIFFRLDHGRIRVVKGAGVALNGMAVLCRKLLCISHRHRLALRSLLIQTL